MSRLHQTFIRKDKGGQILGLSNIDDVIIFVTSSRALGHVVTKESNSLAEPDRIVGNGLGNFLQAFCSSTHQIWGGDECLLIAYVYTDFVNLIHSHVRVYSNDERRLARSLLQD